MIKNIIETTKNSTAKRYLILSIFRSKYCLFAFVLGLIIGYFIVPEKIFNSPLLWVGILYVITFAWLSTCLVRIVKEKAVNMKNAGAGLISIIAAVLGIGVMQVCGVGAPICGATVGVGIFSLFFPHLAVSFSNEHALVIIILSIIVQVLALYYIKCFKGYSEKLNRNN